MSFVAKDLGYKILSHPRQNTTILQQTISTHWSQVTPWTIAKLGSLSKLNMAVSRSRSGTPSLPKDLYYLAINFEPHRLTIPNLKNILLKHHVSPVDCKRKADYVALFEAKVFSKREKIIKKHEDAAKEGMKIALAAQHNRATTVEEGSDSDTSAASLQTTDSEDSDDEEAVGGVGSLNLGTLFNPLFCFLLSTQLTSGT